MTQASPFQPGVRAAIGQDEEGYREAFVDKVYKNGNFTLKGDTQQWRPQQPHNFSRFWKAQQTGQYGWRAPALMLWDEEAEPHIAAQNAVVKRRSRLHWVVNAIRNMKPEHTSEEVVAALEALVSRAQSEASSQKPSRS